MHRHKRYRHGPPLFRSPFRGWMWLIILGFFLFGGKGNWMPGVLIVIGLVFLFNSLFREERPPEPPPPPPFDMPPPPPTRRADPPSSEPVRHPELLPATCPNCGGPVHPHDVKWTGLNSAACSYCGSNLQAKKE